MRHPHANAALARAAKWHSRPLPGPAPSFTHGQCPLSTHCPLPSAATVPTRTRLSAPTPSMMQHSAKFPTPPLQHEPVRVLLLFLSLRFFDVQGIPDSPTSLAISTSNQKVKPRDFTRPSQSLYFIPSHNSCRQPSNQRHKSQHAGDRLRNHRSESIMTLMPEIAVCRHTIRCSDSNRPSHSLLPFIQFVCVNASNSTYSTYSTSTDHWTAQSKVLLTPILKTLTHQ